MSVPFVVGDKVRVYDSEFTPHGVVSKLKQYDVTTGRFSVEVGGRIFWVHPKQFRRIVKRVRREWWLKYSGGAKQWVECKGHDPRVSLCKCVLVREVGPRRTQL